MAEQLRIIVSAETRQLTTGLRTAQARLKTFGNKAKQLGSTLQTRIALPLALAGGAAVKMGMDFDKSMTKIKTLVGVASEEVDAMSSAVKSMATDAGVSSAEAAEAMFFITSAGLRGADAMNVLEMSTKASALGLGDTATVADLATSALNAYGIENLNAVKATDILTAAVREGKLEASELSSVMGQVLPVASNMGVKFEEVGAAFAAMSRTGTPAAQAATQLNSILMAIMKPTKQSAKAMKDLGLSSEGLRKQIKDKGLLSVFHTLKEASIDNAEAFEMVFGNIRALKGIMDLTGASADATTGIFERMSNTSGMTAKAFETLQNSAEFKLRKSLIQLKNSFTELGGVLLNSIGPAIRKVLGFATNLFKSFNKLDPLTQNLSLSFGALVLVLPSLISLGGTLASIFAAMTGPVGLIAAGVAAIAYTIYTNWNEILPVMVNAYNQFVDLYNGSENLRIASASLKIAFKTAFATIQATAGKVLNTFTTLFKLIKAGPLGVASFAGIFAEYSARNKKINTEFGEATGKAITDSLLEALKPMEHKTLEQVQGALTNVGNKVKSFFDVFSGGSTDVKARPKVKSVNAFGTGSSAAKGAAPTDEENDEVKSQYVELGGIVQDGLANLAAGLASGQMTMGDVAGGLLTVLGDIAIQLGKAALKIGIGMLAVQMAFSNPLAAIAAGTALILMGSVMKSMASSFSGQGAGAATAFANGGIISGPTMGLMGEYTGVRSNPEVVAPLDKLKGMIGQQGQKVEVGGQFKIQGQDLVLALQRADKNRNRIL